MTRCCGHGLVTDGYDRSVSTPKILLYYLFAPVSDPEAVALWQRELCSGLGLRGRIIISPHGINGTVGGEIDACKQYVKRTAAYSPFKNLRPNVKWSDGTGFVPPESSSRKGPNRAAPWRQISDFPRLSVKVRDELVAFGAPEEVKVGEDGVIGGGVHLSPTEVNQLVENREDVVFLDGRNAYEAKLGQFKDAVVPDIRTTHGFIEEIESGKWDDLKDRPIITYCTGGVRCEVLSVLMKNRGFSEVYQIDGGIVRYGEAFGNDGLWTGKLVVFDGRETTEFGENPGAISECEVPNCTHPATMLADCEDASCLARYVVCEEHQKHGVCCRDFAAV